MKFLALFFGLALSSLTEARDLTDKYAKYYSGGERLSRQDLAYLADKEIILIPGILSEVFSREDERGGIDFSRLTSEYFAATLHHLKVKLKLPSQKLLSSSRSVAETKALISKTVEEVRARGRKPIFISHSLGGLALMDFLIESDESVWQDIEGALFLQSPFYGTPIASVYLDSPYHADRWLRPFLPFFSTSVETITYLSVEARMKFMKENAGRIKAMLEKVPTITVSGIINRQRSLFTPAADIIEHGCLINALGKCLTQRIWKGRYDVSDGLVPLASSKLFQTDSVVLEGVDHGDPIVKLPLQKMSKEIMTESILRLLIDKSR